MNAWLRVQCINESPKLLWSGQRPKYDHVKDYSNLKYNVDLVQRKTSFSDNHMSSTYNIWNWVQL